MASGHGVPKPRKENHPNRQVGRSSFSDAMAARGREYDAVRAGTMSDEQARRVDINPDKVRSSGWDRVPPDSWALNYEKG